MKEEIMQLIANGHTEEALALLAQYKSDGILLQARYNNGKKQFNLGLIEFSEWQRIQSNINYSATEMIKDGVGGTPSIPPVKPPDAPLNEVTRGNHPTGSAPDVFISYNHKDRAIANLISEYLRAHQIAVTIDHEALRAGGNIQEFINAQLKKKGVVLSLVSKNSLQSGWVGVESNLALYADFFDVKQFIPVNLDGALFERGLVVKVVKDLDSQLVEIFREIEERRTLHIPIDDLKDEEGRLTDLRTSLPKIIAKLKAVNTLDLSTDHFEESMPKIVDAIKTTA